MKLNFYPKTKLVLTSLKRMIAFALVLLMSVGYANSQAPATALAFSGASPLDVTGLTGATVSIPASPSINVSSAITIEAWIFPTRSSGVQDVLSKSTSTTNNGYIFPRTTNGWRNLQFLLNINGLGWQTLEVSYGIAKLNQWHHLSATYDGYYMKIYIDGVLAGTKDIAGTFAVNNNPLTIGGHPGYSEFFTGKVDEVRIWNRALAGCEINNNISCELPSGQNGLAAYYKLNQGFVNLPNPLVTTVTDESGNNNTGTLNGFMLTGLLSNWATGGGLSGTCAVFAPVAATASATNTNIPVGSNIELFASGGDTYSWTGPGGYTSTAQNPVRTGVGVNASGTYTVTVTKNGCSATASVTISVAALGGALNFDGQSNVVVVPNRSNLNPANGFTIETWIKPTSGNPTVQNVVSKSNRISSTGYIFPRTDDGWRSFSFWLDVNGDWKVLSAQFPNLNEWNHVAATYDGFFMKIYLNGNLVGTQVVSGNVIFSNNDLTIGQQDGAPEFYKGSVDETRIWGRPLTQCEIQNNRNCALNGDNNGLATQNSLVAYYRYNQALVNVNNAAYATLADSSGNANNGTLQGFALTGTSSNWVEGYINSTCSPYIGTQATAGSNGPNIEVGTTLNLTASAGTSWSWTGPNNFTSTLQNPSIPNAAINNSGTYTVAITGNGCTSSASTVVTVAFKAGTLRFDGVNDKIIVPNNSSLNITKTITLESWIYPTNNVTPVQDVMSKSTRDVNTGYIFPRTDDGWNRFVFYLHINGQYQKLSAAYPGINEWHHVAATYDGYFMRLYLDGVLAATKEMAGDITSNSNDLVLGSQPGYGEFYGGKVDESRIWNRALNQCEIINNMNCEINPAQKDGLVAYYKYNQGFVGASNPTVNALTDGSDYGNNGTLTDFALSGNTSNWDVFKINGTCSLFTLPPVTAIANASIFGVASTIQLFANGGSTYEWEGPNGFTSTLARPTIPNAQVEASGTYTVTAPFVRCVVTASTRLVVSPLDAVVASGPTTFCPSTTVDLSINNPGTYQWYRNDAFIQDATSNTYTASQTGAYTVKVTNSFGDVTISSPINLLVQDILAPEPDQAVLPTLTILATPRATVTTVPTATDNCKGTIQGTTNSPLVYSTPGNYTITWAYNDQNGQVVYQDQQVIVELGQDITPPVITVPASITANATIATNCGAIVNFAATATDDFEEPVSISYSHNPGTVFPVGTTTVIITAVDASNNTATASFTVTVLPTEVSAITGNTTICAGATTTLSSATANGVWSSDNISVATVNASGVVTGIAAGTANISYTDACGVFASSTISVKATPDVPTIAVADNCGSSVLTATNVSGNILWSTGATAASITVPAGVYTATQSMNGCVSGIATATAAPKAIPAIPSITVNDNCGSTTLTATNITGGILWSTGETTASITVPAGVYTATQSINGCVSGIATATAAPKSIPAALVINVNNDCGSTTLTATNITGDILWSTGATTASITVPAGVYTATQSINGCVSGIATATAAPKSIPAALVINVNNECGSTTLTATNVTGNILWNTGATTASITVPAGVYTATQTVDGCVSATATATAAPKVIPATPAITVNNNCGSTTLTATNITGDILWSTGATTASITVPAGVYTATQSINGCVSGIATATAAPKSIPAALVINVNNECGSTTLTATNVTGNILWSTGATTASITVPAGVYTATQTVDGCVSATATATAAPKVVPATPSITVNNECGSTTLTATNITGDILWSTGATTASITVAAGVYTATQSIDGCVSATATATAAPKVIPATPAITVNDNCGSTTLTVTNITGDILWSTGATTASITVPAGVYTATQSINGCVSGIATATAAPKSIPAALVINVNNDCGSTTLTATNVTGNILWSTGATTASITVPAGVYTATQTVDGCVSATATATAAPKVVLATPSITVNNECGSTTLTATDITGDILWSTGATTASITVPAGVYTATQSINGCVSGIATVTAAPKAIPATPVVVVTNACGSSTLSTNATGTLLWSNGATTSTTTVSASGNYTVTVTNGGCSATSAVTPVTVIPQAVVANISGPSTVVQGSSIQLTNATNGGTWASNSANATVSASGLVSGITIGSATISYTVTTGINCSATATYVVTVQPNCVPPVFTTTPSNSIVNAAAGQCTAVVTYTAIASGTPTPTYTYTFSGATNATGNGTGTGSTFALGTTTVVIKATNGCGTATSSAFSVTVKDITPPNAITRNIVASLDANGSVTVTPAQVDNGSNDNCGAVTLAFATANTTVTTGTICATANENGTLQLTAPTGAIITAINFASYGTPNATCGNFTLGSCNATNSKSIVEGFALGRNSISIPANNSVFTDPCYGTVKRLYVQATYQLNVTSNTGTASSVKFGCAKIGANNVTLQVTDANGNVSNQTAIVTVQDNTAPVITGIANQSFCNIASSFNIPAVSVSDNCGVASITYQVTGATTRSGSGANASGSFNAGTSTITWTATDASGNTNTSSATVTTGGAPVATITASNANAFCNQLTLTGNSVSNATYQWTLGSTTVSNSFILTLDQTNADGNYLLTITAGGCTGTATYAYSKQNFVGSYTILASKEVEIGKYNKVISGSVGVTTAWGEAEFESYSSVTGAGSFVKAPRIDRKGYGINIASQIIGVASVNLPSMQYNTANTYYLSNYTVPYYATVTLSGNYKTLSIRRGANVILNGNTFGTVNIEEGANVKFNSTVLNIETLNVDDGKKDDNYSYVRFAQGTSIRVSKKVSIGSQVVINPDYHTVTFYMADQRPDEEKFTVKGADTKVIANVLMPNGKLRVTSSNSENDDDDDHDNCDHKSHSSKDCKHSKHNHKYCDHRGHHASDCNDDVFMTGLFVAEVVESKGNTVIWSSFACGSDPLPIVSNNQTSVVSQTITGEEKATTSTTEEALKITVMPNPSTTIFTLKFESKYETPVNMRVMDASGRVVDAKTKIGSNSTIQIGANYSSGTYYAEMTQGGTRKVIQLIKVRG